PPHAPSSIHGSFSHLPPTPHTSTLSLPDALPIYQTSPATMPLAQIFQGRTRSEMIGLFLATLELVRRRAITLRQETPGAEISIGDRKSTRLNSSHQIISYAVFCLKKKKNTEKIDQ